MLSAEPVTGQDADLVAALNAERLPTEDLNQAGRRWFPDTAPSKAAR